MKTLNGIRQKEPPSYLIIAAVALLAYLPVSSLLFSLKNDVLMIEYPIQHFMSESLRDGRLPLWFNTWTMGFPLQSVLSWGIYSTPQMLTGLLFKSDVWVLHAEFLLYIMTAGWAMYKLLKTHFLPDKTFSLVLACCYMLSGFTVASSQWLLYITGMTFAPLVLYCLLSLLKQPSLKYALLFGTAFYLHFTNVHIYLTVVVAYGIAFFLLVYLVRLVLKKQVPAKAGVVKFISLGCLFTFVLCAAPAYYSLELIRGLERYKPLADNMPFFQSNYLHPVALKSLVLPLASVKLSFPNTEGVVLNTYLGLLPLALLPCSAWLYHKQRDKTALVLLLIALLFLFVSFGHLTPVRNWLNVLPGLANFRHPGVLRVFFIMAIILFLARSFRNYRLHDVLFNDPEQRKLVRYTLIFLLAVCAVMFAIHAYQLPGIWKGTLYETIKGTDYGELTVINAIIQLVAISVLLWCLIKRKKILVYILFLELIINTFICTPFFTISTYSVKQTNAILGSADGFPVQQTRPYDVPASVVDGKGNTWRNINTYRKEVSTQVSMPGPLILRDISAFIGNDTLAGSLAGKGLVFVNDTSAIKIIIDKQLPAYVQVRLELPPGAEREVVLQQAAFPGWKAYYNEKAIPLSTRSAPFVGCSVPAGNGTLEFVYEKSGVVFTALLLHLMVIGVVLVHVIRKARKRMRG